MVKIFGVTIERIPQEMKDISSKWIKICKNIEEDLNNEIVKKAADYIPMGEVAREEIIAIMELAITALGLLRDLSDKQGFNGRLLTLSSTITAVQHYSETEKKHNLGYYIHCVQIVFDEFFGKK